MDGSRTIVRLAELEIDPARLESYKAALAEEIEVSVRIEPGVLSLSAVSLKDKPASIRILEIYADQQSYEKHLRAPHFVKYKSETADMLRSLTLFETVAIKLCAKSGDERSSDDL